LICLHANAIAGKSNCAAGDRSPRVANHSLVQPLTLADSAGREPETGACPRYENMQLIAPAERGWACATIGSFAHAGLARARPWTEGHAGDQSAQKMYRFTNRKMRGHLLASDSSERTPSPSLGQAPHQDQR